jgi:hypothetical protein
MASAAGSIGLLQSIGGRRRSLQSCMEGFSFFFSWNSSLGIEMEKWDPIEKMAEQRSDIIDLLGIMGV